MLAADEDVAAKDTRMDSRVGHGKWVWLRDGTLKSHRESNVKGLWRMPSVGKKL